MVHLKDQVPICTQSVLENSRSLVFTPLCTSPQPQPLLGFGNSKQIPLGLTTNSCGIQVWVN